jgi:hypothetical protein
MWSQPIVPRVIALPSRSSQAVDDRAGRLTVCVGSARQVRAIEHTARTVGPRQPGRLRRPRRSDPIGRAPLRFWHRSPVTIARLCYGRRTLITFIVRGTAGGHPAIASLLYLGEPIEMARLAVRLRGPRGASAVEALVIVTPPAHAVLEIERRVARRWPPAPANRFVHVDGWITAHWLARPAGAFAGDPFTSPQCAIGTAEPHPSAAHLLALRTRLITSGGDP